MKYREETIKILEKVTKLKKVQIDNILEVPPSLEMGDFAFPCFILSKTLKKAPNQIAEDLLKKLKPTKNISKIETKGPYLNFFINKEVLNKEVISKILKEKKDYGKSKPKKLTVLVESPGQNTNKPLHVGHLRNMLLGVSIKNILEAFGKEVHIVNVINDRGVHICKSLLAYKMFGKGKKPDKKPDHFVGDFYVKYAEAVKKNPKLEEEVQALLLKWEQGDKEVIKLWKEMNSWAYKGYAETYKKLNFKVEKAYYESNSYKHGKEIVLKGLKDGKFEKEEDGAVSINLKKEGLGQKVLLRANGTAVYITQDIYMAKERLKDFKFDEMIYIVGNEQEYHFKALFSIFKRLGYKFADKCYHFSYGMVELPTGKMKSREGTVVDTDDLIEEVYQIATREVKKRYFTLSKTEIDKRAKIISMGAIRFFFVKYDPIKNFMFKPNESLSFEGETGPYVQYAHARINSILKKCIDTGIVDYKALKTKDEQALISLLAEYPKKIEEAATHYKPSIITRYLLDLAQTFNEFYHKYQVLKADENVKGARIAMILAIKQVLSNGLGLLGIDAPGKM
ncbi:arginine--tRNA ligase [Candidatus Woesearchaeota archaeon]|nr:arginine--tRNA ligase [Candidatus Woesearchaeota archaeon]